MNDNRSYEKLREVDIERLLEIERAWRSSLERRIEHWRHYASRLLCVAVTQGGALHLIDGKNGIKDFDLYRFFAKSPTRPDPDPAIYRGRTTEDFGDGRRFGRNLDPRSKPKVQRMTGRNVDIFSAALSVEPASDPVPAIRELLASPRTGTEHFLAEKAVVILDPKPYRIAWPPQLIDQPLRGLESDSRRLPASLR